VTLLFSLITNFQTVAQDLPQSVKQQLEQTIEG